MFRKELCKNKRYILPISEKTNIRDPSIMLFGELVFQLLGKKAKINKEFFKGGTETARKCAIRSCEKIPFAQTQLSVYKEVKLIRLLFVPQ